MINTIYEPVFNNDMNTTLVELSKFLSLVLRHKPDVLGLVLDPQGWIPVADLLASANKHGKNIDQALLEELVFTSDKKRFSFSPDGQKIRANQGHSVDVDLQFVAQEPPDILYHGTATRFLTAIRSEGLNKMQRLHVHLSANVDTATRVGARHGAPVVLRVDAKQMSQDGMHFFLSANGVWLTENVPSSYIKE
ncbi:RNA 2'-phosphotransferase [Herbaspirillum sp. NPDC087042]|uniref:RNA 2'-phosphotransferase n=1 Tax=Herbaspirillum sp. NPDC087042 TaxID=3364004 RepID=UPI00380A0EE9